MSDEAIKIGDLRKRIARRAETLTGVSSDELLRELGAAQVQDRARDGRCNWSIELIASSSEVRAALEQAIREIAEMSPIAQKP